MLEKEVSSPTSSKSISIANSSSTKFIKVIAATESQVSTELCDAVRIFSGGRSGNTVRNTFTNRCSTLSIDFVDFVIQIRTFCFEGLAPQMALGRRLLIEQAG